MASTTNMTISVGLPFFNNERTLADAIRSVFAQTHQDWELILVDDGSLDGSRAVAAAVQDERVRLVTHTSNRGLGHRLNEIAGLARGKYLARMDADDMMHPERLARQIEMFDRQPDLQLVGTAMYSLDRSDRPRGVRGVTTPDTRPLSVLKHALLIHPTITARTQWFLDNPYDETWLRSEDRELYVRTFRTLAFVQLSDPLYFCREEQSAKLAKYLRSCSDDRAIFKKYGVGLVGRPKTAVLCFTSFLKGEVYRVCNFLRADRFIVRRRNQAIPDRQVIEATKVIQRILQTLVPGLDEQSRIAC